MLYVLFNVCFPLKHSLCGIYYCQQLSRHIGSNRCVEIVIVLLIVPAGPKIKASCFLSWLVGQLLMLFSYIH